MNTKSIMLIALLGCLTMPVLAQWIAGPMLGPVELRDASLWVAVASDSNRVEVSYGPARASSRRTLVGKVQTQFDFHWCTFTLGFLEPGTQYAYEVHVTGPQGKKESRGGLFTTKTLWQWRTAPPDFTFLTGSCSYFNEPQYDRPGKPYGLDSSIFETMAGEKASFMLWLGDNWYTREVDFYSNWGLWYRAWRDRSLPVLQPFWRSMSHLAIWDDHDFGPNDYGKSYHLKGTSLDVFRNFWLNPSYGDGHEGIYTRYQYSDVDFFLLDNRWWRDYDHLADSVDGRPNPNKRMFGRKQLDWLKEELRISRDNRQVNFRIIATGSQVLNPVSPFDKMLSFPVEYQELMDFIRDEKIDGVLFLTGDRHHSEIIRVKYPGMYPLYDITCSPLSSGTHTFGGVEAQNPYRVVGLDKLQNYGRITVTGPKNQRVLRVVFAGLNGESLASWEVEQQELKFR